MEKDYPTQKDKRLYHLWRSLNPRLTDNQKQASRQRYNVLKQRLPHEYKPLYATQAKSFETTIGDYLSKLKSRKHHWDFIEGTHPVLVEKNHRTFNKEIQRFKRFRHKFMLSYNDTIVIIANS